MGNTTVNIFWTGGWDSTFRVLQLLIEKKRKVQPHFVVRAQASVGEEIKTMIDIRREIFRNYPETRELLLPTIYKDFAGVKKDNEISSSINSLKQEQELASQYDFCARYCRQYEIHNMEMCIHKDDKTQKLLALFLENGIWKKTMK